jgi:uncharacterized protein YpmS
MPEVELLEFSEIRCSIPNKFIRRCLDKKLYERHEQVKIARKKREIEANIFKLQHALSVVEKLTVRFTGDRT